MHGFTAVIVFGLLADPDAAQPTEPWPVPVSGWVAPKPAEHPRLFFRTSDLPALRQRAATAEGKVMVARLRLLLGGGEAMPAEYNPSRGKQPDGSGKLADAASRNVYTLWHGAGFGMLWQLTGDRKYAELGKECVAKALDGQRDRDNRYSFRDPTGALRAGPCGNTFQFLTLSNTGKHPEARADGDKLVVGGQTVTAKDGVLSFER